MQTYLGCALIGLLGILATGCSVFGIRTFETAGYEVVLRDGRFEIRQYPDALVAETVVEAEYGKAGSVSFRRLAGYIFGGNKSRAQISMTTPVIQEKASERIAMAAPVMQEKSGQGWPPTILPGRCPSFAATRSTSISSSTPV